MNLKPVFSVHEFNEVVNQHLRLLSEVVVEGEISQMQVSQGKWLFMTIKDDRASVGVFGMTFKLSGVNTLEEGMKVRVTGYPGLYQRSGRFNINATSIVPAGEGALRLAYERLKTQLSKEGLFDPERKRSVPRFPQKIGLVTAKDSRAYSDFVKVLEERMGGLEIVFYPVQVQGNNAVSSILQSFKYFSKQKDIDVIVMTRGGGSLEDLLSFNDESVARAVFASKIPVVSAIGHEEDVALTDFVADVRASTPSNAAELIIPSRTEVLAQVQRAQLRLEQGVFAKIRENERIILRQAHILTQFFESQKRSMQNMFTRMYQQVQQSAELVRLKQLSVASQKQRLELIPGSLIMQKTAQVVALERLLKNLDPEAVLQRGFSITRDTKGAIISDINDLSPGDQVVTTVQNGSISAQIQTIQKGRYGKKE